MSSRGQATLGICTTLLSLLSGCAGRDLAVRAGEIRRTLHKARANGAYTCAPRELALSEANLEFAERELDRGEYFPALDHVVLAEAKANEALRLAPAENCGKPMVVAAPSTLDTDGDGIPDSRDRCPTSAEDPDGFEDNDGCPDIDNDQDGIPDASDRCPNEPEDKDGFEDEDGCPDLDNDQDGVPDQSDRCPNEPGSPEANGDGCPKRPTLVSVTNEKIELHQAVFFATGKAVIMSQSFRLLDEVADVLKSRPAMQVRIEGHTDSRGRRADNVRLSQARADSVKVYLVGRGIDAGRLVAVGYGPDQPIETNKTAAGREKNRRVEFMILQQ